jgi:hypothetical protein
VAALLVVLFQAVRWSLLGLLFQKLQAAAEARLLYVCVGAVAALN